MNAIKPRKSSQLTLICTGREKSCRDTDRLRKPLLPRVSLFRFTYGGWLVTHVARSGKWEQNERRREKSRRLRDERYFLRREIASVISESRYTYGWRKYWIISPSCLSHFTFPPSPSSPYLHTCRHPPPCRLRSLSILRCVLGDRINSSGSVLAAWLRGEPNDR